MKELTVIAHDVGPVGGMERQLTELIKGVKAAGWTVTVIARSCVLPEGLTVRFVRVPGPRRPFAIAYPWFFAVGSLLTAVRARGLRHSTGAIVVNRIDVCAVHLCHHSPQLSGVLRASRSASLYRLNARVAGWMSRWGERWSFRRARRLGAVSAGVAREIRDAFPHLADRIEVLPNGVDAERFAAQEPRRAGTRALFVGSEWEGKGLGIAIRALASAPDWTLDVVGTGDVDRYLALARSDAVQDRVTFHGRREDPERFYAAASAFVLPSAYETFSLVTYEAAASGLPLIATRVSGVEDLLVDGLNGYFVGRDPAEVAACLRRLTDGELAASLGSAARAAALEHTWERMVAAHLEVYEDVNG